MYKKPSAIECSARASLVALGVRFQQLNIWPVVQDAPCVKIKQKVLQYTPLEKVLDTLRVINTLRMAGGVVEMNTRVRPDRALQLAFGRTGCAEQSTISDTLNACTTDA